MPVRLYLNNVGKSFTMHLQGGTVIPVVEKVEFSVDAGECVVLGGPSGAGKSSILKMIYGNYRCDDATLAELRADDRVAFRYVTADGRPTRLPAWLRDLA